MNIAWYGCLALIAVLVFKPRRSRYDVALVCAGALLAGFLLVLKGADPVYAFGQAICLAILASFGVRAGERRSGIRPARQPLAITLVLWAEFLLSIVGRFVWRREATLPGG